MHAPGRNSMCRPYKKKYKDQIRLEEPVAWCFAQERRERDTYKMNILAPVKKADEIEYLVACGATELYCGYIPQIWIQTYMDVEDIEDMHISINKREALGDNVLDIIEMQEIIEKASIWKVPVYVTLNRLNFPQSCYNVLELGILELVAVGVKNFIVTDIGLIAWLKSYDPELNITVSTCAVSLNSWSNQLYAELGAKRMTFPRHMSITEIEEVCKHIPDMEFECFILDQGCQYDDGNCRILHSCGAICRDQWNYEYFRTDQKAFVEDEMEEIYRNEFYYTRWLRPYPAKDYQINQWGTIFCTICNLPRLSSVC